MIRARPPGRVRKTLFLGIYLGLTVLCALAYYSQYHRWRDCFNALGRCFDPEDAVVYTTSGFVWGVLAAICALLALASLARLRR